MRLRSRRLFQTPLKGCENVGKFELWTERDELCDILRKSVFVRIDAWQLKKR